MILIHDDDEHLIVLVIFWDKLLGLGQEVNTTDSRQILGEVLSADTHPVVLDAGGEFVAGDGGVRGAGTDTDGSVPFIIPDDDLIGRTQHVDGPTIECKTEGTESDDGSAIFEEVKIEGKVHVRHTFRKHNCDIKKYNTETGEMQGDGCSRL